MCRYKTNNEIDFFIQILYGDYALGVANNINKEAGYEI